VFAKEGGRSGKTKGWVETAIGDFNTKCAECKRKEGMGK
jgi:hypothetical protein